MPDVVINYANIIRAVGEEFQNVWYALKDSDDEGIVSQITNIKKIEVSDEQSFNKKKGESKIEKGTVYIVVRFGSGSINYGSSVTPISLYVMGTANKVKPTQLLLSVFASVWTTKNLCQGLYDVDDNSLEALLGGDKMLQVWNTPEIITNFNEIDADFKNLFRLTGNIVAGASAVRVGVLTYYYGSGANDYETINVMSFGDGYRMSLNSQPFGNTHGFAKSEGNFSTYTFSVSTYLLDNHLTADLLAIRGFRNRNGGAISSVKAPNDDFKIKLDFTNGFNNMPNGGTNPTPSDSVWNDQFFNKFKVVDSQIGQEIAGIPTIVITFAR